MKNELQQNIIITELKNLTTGKIEKSLRTELHYTISQECVGWTQKPEPVTCKGIQNTQTNFLNKLYLTSICIAKTWGQNENGHENRQGDSEKPPQ